jgi:hypothetical protein
VFAVTDHEKDGRARSLTIATALFAGFLTVYLTLSDYVASGDTTANELLAVSLLREGDFDFDEFHSPGDSMPYAFTTWRGRVINIVPVVTGMTNVPVFAAAMALGVDPLGNLLLLNRITMSIIAALSVAVMYLTLIEAGAARRTALACAAAMGAGTLVWSMAARGSWQHGPSILFLSCALYLIHRRGGRLLPLSGFFLALMCVNRPANAMLAIPIYLWVLLRRTRSFPAMVLASLPPLAFLAWYSLEYWGSLLSLGQGQGSKFTGNPLVGIPGLLLSPARGLLIHSPVFVFPLAYIFTTVIRRGGDSLHRWLTGGMAVSVLCYSWWERWSGGHCFGYRYLSEMIPILILFTAAGWDRLVARSRLTRALFVTTLALSAYANFLGAVAYPTDFNTSPDNVDFHERRLWSADTELTRCHEVFWASTARKLSL